jgi:hypothetical protein
MGMDWTYQKGRLILQGKQSGQQPAFTRFMKFPPHTLFFFLTLILTHIFGVLIYGL